MTDSTPSQYNYHSAPLIHSDYSTISQEVSRENFPLNPSEQVVGFQVEPQTESHVQASDNSSDYAQHNLQSSESVHVQSQTSEKEHLPCCSIVISNITKRYDKEIIRLYFESENRSGGGEVASVEILGSGIAKVEFNDPQGTKVTYRY